MKISKKAAIILSAAGLMVAGAGVIHAAAPTVGTNNRMSALVNAIAQKFNLNPSDVQQVVDQTEAQQRSQMQANMQQHYTDRINQAVKNGQLTQDQANKILAKQQEVQSFMDSLSGKSQADRQAAIKNEMTLLQQWAKDNNIPQQFVPFAGGRHGMMNFKGQGVTGTVTAINGSTITLKGRNGTTYTVDASKATVTKITAGTNNSQPAKTTIQVSQIQVNDNLMVQGTISGNTITATNIIDGALMGRGMGMGFGNRMMR